MNEKINELIQAFLSLKSNCSFPHCNINCPFFVFGGNCSLRNPNPPSTWVMPPSLIANLRAQTLEKVEENNETPNG